MPVMKEVAFNTPLKKSEFLKAVVARISRELNNFIFDLLCLNTKYYHNLSLLHIQLSQSFARSIN